MELSALSSVQITVFEYCDGDGERLFRMLLASARFHLLADTL